MLGRRFRRGSCGDEQNGEAGRMDLLGSNAKDLALEAPLWFASVKELTRDCGPNEKDEPIECRGRELDGELRSGTAGIANVLFCGGGVEDISNIEHKHWQSRLRVSPSSVVLSKSRSRV